jgi:hypothetical protein
VEVLVASAAKGNKVLQPFLCVTFIRPVMNVQFNVVTPAQAAAIPVSTMYLLLQDCSLLRLPALRVGLTAIVGKEGLLAKVVQASLIFGMSSPLCDARLAEEIGKVVADLVLTKNFQGAMHPEQMLTIHRLQLRPAIQAIEGHHGLRVHKIAHVADASKRGFGKPPGLYVLPKPKQRQQDFEVVAIVQIQSPPDRQLHEVTQRVPAVLGYLLATRPCLFSMGNEVEVLAEGFALIPPRD